jgi:predicted Zn-dependent protease
MKALTTCSGSADTTLSARKHRNETLRDYMKRMCHLIVGLGAILTILASCSTAPETGRRQLMLISPSEETQLGLSTFQTMKQEIPVSKDRAANALVRKVGRRIAAVAPLTNAQWEFVVFGSNEVNAFCLPGGKVGVYTGILPVTQNEAGLATVLAHEIAHAAARHGGERMSEALAIQGVGQSLGAAISDPRWQQAFALGYGVGTTVGVALPHSRGQESEADQIGLLYMARAGYNPEEAIRFWERFKDYNRRTGRDEGLTFLRTHPVDDDRIKALQAQLPKAMQEYRTHRQSRGTR